MPQPSSHPKPSAWNNGLILGLSLLLCLTLLSTDGETWPFFRKFAALEFFSSKEPSERLRHEIHVPDFIGHEKPKRILVSGTCFLLSVWCTRVKAASKCSVAKQLEGELYQHGLRDYRVLNLAIPDYVAGYNVANFLDHINEPATRVFIWNNDFSTSDVSLNNPLSANAGSPQLLPLYSQLENLRKSFPDIPELGELMALVKGRGFAPARPSPVEEPSTSEEGESPGTLFKLIQARRQRASVLVSEFAEKNTRFLRDFERRLPELFALQRIPASFDDVGPIVTGDRFWEFHTTYGMTDQVRGKSPAEVNRDNILTVRLMGKLAEKFHKTFVLYFGPEGRCDRDGLYSTLYKKPLIEAVKGLPAVRILDFTDMKLVLGRDTHTCHQLSYLGSAKVADRMLRELEADGVL